jgi:ABC-type transport system involved in multi-copper enzyme maturation permease subunit
MLRGHGLIETSAFACATPVPATGADRSIALGESATMKFLAVIKDSFREALDCKALYVLLALSGLAILLVMSLSFKLLPAQKMMEELISGNVQGALGQFGEAGAFGDEHRARGPEAGQFHLDALRAVHGAADSPDSEYVLSISMRLADKADADKVRQASAEVLEKLKQHFALVEQLHLLKVMDIRFVAVTTEGGQHKAEFELHTQPTEATRRLWPAEPSLFFGALPLQGIAAPLGLQLFFIASIVLTTGSWVAVLVGVIITAFFIPNMLQKGTIDLMLVKPVQRWSILLFKYLGGLTFILLNTAVAVAGIWVALGLRSGIWANSFLLMIFVITFYFAVLYAVSTLTSVFTRSAVVAILATCAAWFVFYIINSVHLVFDVRHNYEQEKKVPLDRRWGDNAFASVVRAVHFVTPRTSDMRQLGDEIIRNDFLTGDIRQVPGLGKTSITWGESLTVSGIFVVLILGLACWRFATKDY